AVLDYHGPVGRVRGRQSLSDVENGTRRDAAAQQTGAQFFRILIDEDGLKKIMQLRSVLHPEGVRPEARIVGQVRASQECAGRPELTVVSYAQKHRTGFRREFLVRGDARMPVAAPGRDDACLHVSGCVRMKVGQRAIVKTHVQLLSESRSLTL